MNVGELIAYLKLDDSQFQSGMGRSKNAFSGLMNVAKAAGQVVATGLTTGAVAGGVLLTNLMKTGLSYNSLQQNSRAALSTMLGGAQAANAQMDKLDEFARNSPFAKQVFIQAQQQMLGFGVATDKVLPALDAVQNAVAATGGSSDAIANVTYALSQMQAQGKFSGETLRDLGVYGIDAATIVGEKMGKTGEEIRAMASKPGGIPVAQVWDPLITGLTEKFGGATDNIKQQWSGALDRIKGAWRDIGATLAAPFIDPNGGGRAVVWANLVADGLRGIEKHVKAAAPVIEKALGPAFEKVEGGIRKANVAIAGFNLQGAIRQVKQLSDYTPLIAASTTALTMLGLKPIPWIGGLATGIWPLVGAVAALVATDPQLRGLGDAFQTGLGDAGTTVNDIIVAVADLAMGLLGELTPGLLAGAEGAGKLAGMGLELASMLVDVLSAGTPVIGMVSDLVSWLVRLPTPVLAGVTAFAAFKTLGMPKVFTDIGTSAVRMGSSFKSGAGEVKAHLWAATQGVDGLKMAGSGLVGVLGRVAGAMKAAFMANLPMIAISALVTVLGAFAQASANAKSRADSYATALDGVTDAAERTASAAEVATNAFVTGENADWGWVQKRTGFDSVADALEAMGLSATSAGDAIAGTDAEFEAYLVSIQAAADKTPELTAAAEEVTIKMHQQRNSLSEAERQLQQKARADADAAAAAEEHSAALKAQRDAMDSLIQAEQTLAAAKGDLVAAQYATKDAIDAANESLGETGKISRDAAGNIDTTTASYRALDEASLDLQRAMTTELEAMQKAGASQEDLNAKRDEFLGKQRANAEAWGLEGAEVDAYIERVGGIPEVVSTKVQLGTDAAYSDLKSLVDQIAESHGTMIIDARNDPAQQKLLSVLGLVNDGTGVFAIDADDSPAIATLLASLGTVDTSTGTLTIDGNDQEAMSQLRNAKITINGTTGTLTIAGRDMTSAAREEAKRNIDNTRGTVKIYGSDAGALDTAYNIKGQIDQMSAVIKINGQRVAGTWSGGITQADGGLVQFFKNGGRSENHIAQYAPAGSWRVWAEPETGGEWYIPRAASKRQRSLQIAAEMVRDFGYQMVPLGSSQFANGSPGSRFSSTLTGAAITIGNVTITVPIDELEQIKDVVEFGETIRRKLMMQGVSV